MNGAPVAIPGAGFAGLVAAIELRRYGIPAKHWKARRSGRNGEFDHLLMEDVYWRTRRATARFVAEAA